MSRNTADWEAIEREYRAGQLSVSEIGRQHGLSHTAINKRAKRDGWARNLSARVREEVSARLVSAEVAETNERAAINTAAARGVEVVRQHRNDLGEGRKLVSRLLGELDESTTHRDEIAEAIEDETADDQSGERRARMLRAVALPGRSGVIKDLSAALKNLIPLERQAFNLDAATDPNAGDHEALRALLTDIDGATRGIPSAQGPAD